LAQRGDFLVRAGGDAQLAFDIGACRGRRSPAGTAHLRGDHGGRCDLRIAETITTSRSSMLVILIGL